MHTRLAKTLSSSAETILLSEGFSFLKTGFSYLLLKIFWTERCLETHFGHNPQDKGYTSGYRTTKTHGMGFLAEKVN